jgi:outer membrane receptor protein involved in Fe transport
MAKVRAAVAQVGNDTDPYNTLLTYTLNQPFGAHSRVSVPNTLPNAELKPEITTEYEFGTEWKALNDRIGVNFSFYNRKTRDQIIPLSRSAATGFTYKYVNAGLMENKGVELSLYGTPVKTGDFSWEVNLNWARNRNKIVKLTDDQKILVLSNAPFAVQLQAREGESFGSLVGYDYVYDAQGNKVVDEKGFYKRSAEQKVLGSVLPQFNGGALPSVRSYGVTLTLGLYSLHLFKN